jgi:hypothetical protein
MPESHALSSSGDAEVLTGEASGPEVGGGDILESDLGDVSEVGDVGPVGGEDG